MYFYLVLKHCLRFPSSSQPRYPRANFPPPSNSSGGSKLTLMISRRRAQTGAASLVNRNGPEQSVISCFEIQNCVFWSIEGLIRNSLKNGKNIRSNKTNYLNNSQRRTLLICVKSEWGIVEIRVTFHLFPCCTSAKNPLRLPHSWLSFFLSLFSKTKPNHWTKLMASTL